MKKIPLIGHTKPALVDDEDYDYLTQWEWRALFVPWKGGYYAVRRPEKGERCEGRWIWMHEEVVNKMEGRTRKKRK